MAILNTIHSWTLHCCTSSLPCQSFYRYNSFRNPVSAIDVVHAVTALLEMGGDDPIQSSAADNNNASNLDTMVLVADRTYSLNYICIF